MSTFLPATVRAEKKAPTMFGVEEGDRLNEEVISRAYMESEWDKVKPSLEAFLKRNEDSQTEKEQKIFAMKYLGVIYAADSTTSTRAESYFNRLLDIDPTIEIHDMYVSKKVMAFFKEVKTEHLAATLYRRTHGLKNPGMMDTLAATPKTPGRKEPEPVEPRPKGRKGNSTVKSGSKAWVFWTTVGAVTVVGAGTYYAMNRKTTKETTTDIRPPSQ